MPKRLLLALAVLGALVVPTQAVAAPKPTPTTGIDFDFVSFTQYGPATFHVDDLRLQMVSADTACWYLTLSGDPTWKDIDGDGQGEWLVQSQDPSVYPFSIQGRLLGGLADVHPLDCGPARTSARSPTVRPGRESDPVPAGRTPCPMSVRPAASWNGSRPWWRCPY